MDGLYWPCRAPSVLGSPFRLQDVQSCQTNPWVGVLLWIWSSSGTRPATSSNWWKLLLGRILCAYHYRSCSDENCSFFFSQSFRLYCSDKDNFHTSSSKNPERSRDDAIPINWKALIWWVVLSPGDGLISFWRKKKQRKPEFSDQWGTDMYNWHLSWGHR